jgi:hypothetical protein
MASTKAKTSPDLSEFVALSNPRRCKVCTAAAALSDTEREQLAAACATPRGVINAGAIKSWLAARGHDISITAITHHRAGTIGCD